MPYACGCVSLDLADDSLAARKDVNRPPFCGTILFGLLTGERPLRGNFRMLLAQVINDESPAPRKLDNIVPRDLETICLKCLEKHPAKRYGTAKDVAEELRRFLSGQPYLPGRSDSQHDWGAGIGGEPSWSLVSMHCLH